MQKSWIVWPSGWIRTFFFNPTRPDEQNPKPSPRVRTSELAQDSGSNRTWSLRPIRRTNLIVRLSSSNKIFDSILDLRAQLGVFVWRRVRVERSTNKNACSIQPVGRNPVFDLTRRTKTRARSTRSNKKTCSIQLVELRIHVQPCPNLGLDARARVQHNPTVILNVKFTFF